MIGRLLAVVTAAALTMGAVVPYDSARTAYVTPNRAPAQSALRTLVAAAEQPGGAEAVRRLTGAIAALDEVSPDPAEVAVRWASLAPAARSALVDGAPGVVGNLEGLPYDVRDAANRAVLADVVRSDEQALSTAGRGRGEGMLLAAQLNTLRQIQAALEAPVGGPRRYLLTLDPTTAGRAAIAVGDLGTAKYVGFLVPGMYFSVRDQIVDWTATAANVQATETAELQRSGADGEAAVVSWIGYQTPDILNVVGLSLAQQGATRLADAVNGFRQARAGAKPFVTVLAHSYGATAALLALQNRAFRVDAVAMVGVPGSPAQSVAELDVTDGAVYVGEAALDGVATSGFFGSDPTATSYGARQFRTGGAIGHNAYFAPRSESLRNIALVGVGRFDDVTLGSQQLALGD